MFQAYLFIYIFINFTYLFTFLFIYLIKYSISVNLYLADMQEKLAGKLTSTPWDYIYAAMPRFYLGAVYLNLGSHAA